MDLAQIRIEIGVFPLAFRQEVQIDRPVPDKRAVNLFFRKAVFGKFIKQSQDQRLVDKRACRHALSPWTTDDVATLTLELLTTLWNLRRTGTGMGGRPKACHFDVASLGVAGPGGGRTGVPGWPWATLRGMSS